MFESRRGDMRKGVFIFLYFSCFRERVSDEVVEIDGCRFLYLV